MPDAHSAVHEGYGARVAQMFERPAAAHVGSQQHVESVGPTVQQITGVQVRETVPDWVMQRVDEIVLADLTPQALQKRMERGDIYPVDRAQRALSHFFRPGNLIALRELALRQVTGVVDRSLDAFLDKDATQPAHTVRERHLFDRNRQ